MSLYYDGGDVQLHHGDALEVARTLPDGLARTIVTSPPYFGLRDYGEDGQIGAEPTLAEYIDRLIVLFRELRRVLADDGTFWLNLGDSYASKPVGSFNGGSGTFTGRNMSGVATSGGIDKGAASGLPEKNLIGVPWRVALALQADGWILRSDVIWAKSSVMPESVTDRPTKAHEYMFMFAKRPSYFYDSEAIAEPVVKGNAGSRFDTGKTATHQLGRAASGEREQKDTRNKRTVWTVAPVPFSGAHFAVYPPELIRPCILAGSQPGDVVLDPFSGSGTTGQVATFEGRKYVGIDLNREYLDLSLRTRFQQPTLPWEASA